jgi:hypothetical protein
VQSLLRASPGWPLSFAFLATLKPGAYFRVRPCDIHVAPLATRATHASHPIRVLFDALRRSPCSACDRPKHPGWAFATVLLTPLGNLCSTIPSLFTSTLETSSLGASAPTNADIGPR